MRKLIITAMVAGSILSAGAFVNSAMAQPSEACGTQPYIANVGPSGGQLTVCITQGPVKGNVTAAGNPTTPSGYVIADGDTTNQGALRGYIGISSVDTTPSNPAGLVGCSGQSPDPKNTSPTSGPGHPDYNPAGGNNALVDPANPPVGGSPTRCSATPPSTVP